MINEIKRDAKTRMSKSVESLRHDLTRLRTGRASTALVEHLKVNYYGTDVPLSQVANVSVADARSIQISPWEKPMVAAVEKAILASDLGLTPNTAGTIIRINLPALTEERRKELSRHVGQEGRLDVDAASGEQQVVHLGEHDLARDQGLMCRLDDRADGVVVLVVAIDGGDQRPGIDEQDRRGQWERPRRRARSCRWSSTRRAARCSGC